ncbi:MAG TPA: DUF1614 domain-containing protein [Thermodesulforhabdus norvegica]|uniref:DUF1614 domain-containing protein n=1 Tax=Thermodesulforhabdus norvegica TaxID=39841 RepID=A0A7C0WST2_9BACT|nr:DUF1614 domain-containing protein [Deltaproteobacteria bacterium]MBW2068990.1 DUF1614 domain-containing protein [Deltaproteobacteria bacterium]HDL89343.1 DUF1614 domain-containing protein [Thermodesulforhabdus norvegica]
MLFFPPFLLLFFFLFLFLLFLLFIFIKWGIITIAFAKLGIPPGLLFLLLLMSMLGSMINIPVRRIKVTEEIPAVGIISFFGIRYRPPRMVHERETVVAVNVGGAVIPTLLSIYFFLQSPMPIRVLIAVAIVTMVVNKLARPIPGVGIATPMLVPPLVAALTALLITPGWAPPAAYISGTMGTLIGADLMNLKKLGDLRAPVVSIGGAGTFDGIFLTGIIAVLLA